VKRLIAVGVAVACVLATPRLSTAAGPAPVPSLADLEAQARRQTSAVPRVPLAPTSAEALRAVDSFEPASSGRVPNYLRALAAVKPPAAKSFARLVKTFAYAGNLSPALKLAMALRIAQVNRSPYAVAHLERLLHATGPDGDAYVAKLRDEYKADIDIMKLASELVIDAVIPGDRLRGELAERFARLEGRRDARPKRKHLVPPV